MYCMLYPKTYKKWKGGTLHDSLSKPSGMVIGRINQKKSVKKSIICLKDENGWTM